MRLLRATPRSASSPSLFRAVGRRGVETLEFILCAPIMLIGTIALVQFGIILTVYQAVATAAIEGAREAARENGNNTTAVVEIVNTILSPHQIVFPAVASPGSGLRLILEDGATVTETGDNTLACTPNGPAAPINSNETRVTLCLTFTAGKLPNWLSGFGFSLGGRNMEVSALTEKE